MLFAPSFLLPLKLSSPFTGIHHRSPPFSHFSCYPVPHQHATPPCPLDGALNRRRTMPPSLLALSRAEPPPAPPVHPPLRLCSPLSPAAPRLLPSPSGQQPPRFRLKLLYPALTARFFSTLVAAAIAPNPICESLNFQPQWQRGSCKAEEHGSGSEEGWCW